MRIKALYFFLIILTISIQAKSQSNILKNVSGLPTKELYDLLVDSKGFLWVADDLGISRFDGVNFVPYSNAEQTSLSATDIVEDHQGRIWFHNFTGQIFYIEHEKMYLLAAYDFKKENYFPRIALFNNTLVATTSRGLFICNTSNLQCSYVKCTNAPGLGTASLAVMNDAVIAYGEGNWFIYREKSGLRKVELAGESTNYIKNNSSTLALQSYKDTAYIFSNPAGALGEITINGDSLQFAKKINTGDIINTVTVKNNGVWVNTFNKTFLLGHPAQQVGRYDITDMEIDHEGNQWYSSLKNGLLVKYNHLINNLKHLPVLKDDEVLKYLTLDGDKLLLGTQNSSIVLYDYKRNKVLKEIQFPGKPGAVSYIHKTGANTYLIGTSVNSYQVDLNNGKIDLLPYIKTIKQAAETAQFKFIAAANGLFVIPINKQREGVMAVQFKGLTSQHDGKTHYLYNEARCRAVCFDTVNNAIFGAFKNGLFITDKNGTRPYLYNGKYIHATSLVYYNGSVIVSTISNGVLILNQGKIRHITVNEGLSSNSILKAKKTGNWIWLIGAGATRVLDLKTLNVVNDLNLSELNETLVLDVEETGNKAFLITTDGFYTFSILKSTEKFEVNNFLSSVNVNGKTLPWGHLHQFSYFENDIRFNLTVPFYYHADEIYFKYTLEGAHDPGWQLSKPGDRTINFSELSPGNYRFKAIAIHPQFGNAVTPVIYSFRIDDLWWQTWWFKLLIGLFFLGVIAYTVVTYFSSRLKIQKALYEQQLSIQNERQRISSEMHDDVGAGLSALKLYLNMAEHNNGQLSDISQISGMINDMSEKINEIIWSNNTENDTFESLLYYIQYQSFKLFKHSGINFEVIAPSIVPYFLVRSEKRRNTYLVVKEFLHNALKHSKASSVRLDMKTTHDELIILIEDNGVGFDQLKTNSHGMGMKNTKLRVTQLNGKLKITSDGNGTIIHIAIPLSQQ